MVRHRRVALIHNDLRLARGSLDLFDVALDGVQRHLIGVLDGVPYTQIVTILRHDHLTIRHPLSVVAVRQQRVLLGGSDVVQVELSPLVSEEQFIRMSIQLQEIDLGIMSDGADYRAMIQILDLERLQIQQKSDHLGGVRCAVINLRRDE